jgi:hypothetical protein
MDGIHRVKDYGIGFVHYHAHPFTVLHLSFLLAYMVVTFFLYDYLFQYQLFKWMYIGSIIIVIGTIYGDIKPAAAASAAASAAAAFNLGTS